MFRETKVTELTGSHRETEKRRLTESGARQRAGAAGPAYNDKNAGNANEQAADRLCFRFSCRCVTRFAGLSRAAAVGLRSFSVTPFLRIETVASPLSVTC